MKLADAEATGTITNTDAMPRAWMVRFGRTVGSQVVDALTQRLDDARGSHVTVAGINVIGESGVEPEAKDDDPFGLPEWANNAEREADAANHHRRRHFAAKCVPPVERQGRDGGGACLHRVGARGDRRASRPKKTR